METTEAPQAFDKIAAALAKARMSFGTPKRTKKGQQGNRTFLYAPMEEINAAVDKALSENGLSCPSFLEWKGDAEFVTTDLRHESGQFIRSTFRLSPNLGVQDRGKEQSYGRRYNKRLLLDLADGDADVDDGHAAVSAESHDDLVGQLVELMGNAAPPLGNKPIMDYCRANGLGDGRSPGDLPDATLRSLVKHWKTVEAACRTVAKPPSEPATAKVKPTHAPTPPAAPSPVEAELAPAVVPLLPTLDVLLAQSGKTRQQIVAYNGAKKHVPPFTAETIPLHYQEKLVQNWAKVCPNL